jgi:hypothetical protein
MSGPLVKRWLDAGELDLPLPGSGQTATRWRKLAALAEIDVVAGRLAEAHADATAILEELGAKPPEQGELWAVWAAESPEVTLTVDEVDGFTELNGTKSWCSGAGLCTHALVTANRTDGARGLYAVDLRCPQVTPLEDSWRNAGMKDADTRTVQFSSAAATPVGDPGEYLQRAGFWYGAIGVAACWLERSRRSELRRATSHLGLASPTSLGLPDGTLCDHETGLADTLGALLSELRPGAWCAATWRGDGHPDHEAVGRAAAVAAQRAGAKLLEYPGGCGTGPVPTTPPCRGAEWPG